MRLDDLFLGLYFTHFYVKSQKSVVYSQALTIRLLIKLMCPLCASVLLYYSYFICRQEGCPKIHLGPVAAGRHVVKEDRLRQQFATQVGALAFDCEFDSVIESILGNCKDSFVCIRGKYCQPLRTQILKIKCFSRYFRLQRWYQTQRVATVRFFGSSQRYEKHYLWHGTAY